MNHSTLELLGWFASPILLYMGLNFIVHRFSLKNLIKVKLADIMVPILFIVDNHLSKLLFHESILAYLFISAFILGIGIAVIQAYFYDEINYHVYFKMFWRFLFLLLIVFYLFLFICIISVFQQDDLY